MMPVRLALANGKFLNIGDVQPYRRQQILNATVIRSQYGHTDSTPLYHIQARIDK